MMVEMTTNVCLVQLCYNITRSTHKCGPVGYDLLLLCRLCTGLFCFNNFKVKLIDVWVVCSKCVNIDRLSLLGSLNCVVNIEENFGYAMRSYKVITLFR